MNNQHVFYMAFSKRGWYWVGFISGCLVFWAVAASLIIW